MNFRGTSLKVHWLTKPARILCSQIFLSPAPTAAHVVSHAGGGGARTHSNNHNGYPLSQPMNMSLLNASGFDGTASDISSLDTASMSSFTGTDSAIYSPLDGSRASFQLDGTQQHQDVRWSSGTDSGVNSDSPWNTSVSSYPYQQSTRSSFGSVYSTDQDQRKTSIDSSIQGDALYNGGFMGNGQPIAAGQQQQQHHMQRRVMRNLSTSFENHNTLSDYIGVIGDSTTNVVGGAAGGGGGVGSNGCGSDAAVSKWRRNSEQINNERLSNPEMARRKASGETISIPFYSHGRLTGGGGGHGSGGGGGGSGHSHGRRSKLGIAVCVSLHENYERYRIFHILAGG